MIEILEKFRNDLESSMFKGLGLLTFDTLLQNLSEGKLHLLSSDDAVIVYEDSLIKGKRIFNTVLCGGELNSVEVLHRHVEKLAKENNADGVMIIGRKGWGRVFDGYKDVATLYFKEFEK